MRLPIIEYIDDYIINSTIKYNKIHIKFIKKIILKVLKIKIKDNALLYYNTEVKHDINMYYSMIYFIYQNKYKYDNINDISLYNFNSKFIAKFTINNNDEYSNLQINIVVGDIEYIDIEMITSNDREYKCIHKNISNAQLSNKSGDLNKIFNTLDDIIIDSFCRYLNTKLLEVIL